MCCGSGFPAASLFDAGIADRGWKAAPTTKPTHKILKLPDKRPGGTSPRQAGLAGYLLFFLLSQMKMGKPNPTSSEKIIYL
jgi:hypothetical protein